MDAEAPQLGGRHGYPSLAQRAHEVDGIETEPRLGEHSESPTDAGGDHDRLQIQADAIARGAALGAVIENLRVDDKAADGQAGVRQPAGLAPDVDAADAEGVEVAAGEVVCEDVRGA